MFTRFRNKFLFQSLSIIILISSFISCSFAWFSSNVERNNYYFNGHAVFGYFDSGNGTANSPYIISEPKHLYNLVWLQNTGAFEEKTYFKIKDGVTEIDMAGFLSGTNGVSGAIPPIGTSGVPFKSEFDGNGAIIKNLWVSTNPEDWYEKPHSLTNEFAVGTDIGLFGNIAYGANVRNFFLENIEITNTVNNVNLGIIAGYVNGNIGEIGVKNAKFSLDPSTDTKIVSDYSLIGYKTENVIWEDLPSDTPTGSTPSGGGAGGNLIINPTADDTAERTYNTTNIMAVPGSVQGTAFFVGSLHIITPKPKPSTAYKYNNTIKFTDNSGNSMTYLANTNTTTQINLDDPENIEEDFIKLMKTNGDINAIVPERNSGIVKPDFSAVTAVTTESANLKYPTNSVWFKPIAAGNCSIAFCRQNNSADETMSIYRYKRNDDKTINESSMQEIILNFTKTNGLGNGCTTYFNLDITQEEVNAGYEYIIGASSTSSGGSAGFVFLKLAGTDVQGGTGPAPDGYAYRMLKNIDFVEIIGSDLDLTNLDVHRSIIEITGTQTGGTVGAIYYNATGGIVIYCNEAVVSVTQKIQTDIEAQSVAYSPTAFPPRQNTKSTSPVP